MEGEAHLGLVVVGEGYAQVGEDAVDGNPFEVF